MAMRRHRGFTLVEVLVALAILAVLAALAWRGIDGMLRARDSGRQAIERSARLATILTQWEQDLDALFDSGIVPAIAYDGRTLRLTRTVRGGVALVAWSLRDGGRWQRWSTPALTRAAALREAWLASQQLRGDEPGQVLLRDDASEWQIYFFRGNGWSNAQSSADIATVPNPAVPAAAASGVPNPAVPANTVARELLPDGVRLLVTLGGQQLTRDIALPLRNGAPS